MKKLTAFILFSCLLTAVNSHASSYECNLNTQYCIYIRGDESLTELAVATIAIEGKVNDEFVSDDDIASVNNKQYHCIALDLDDLKPLRIQYMDYRISSIDDQPMTNCNITFTSNSLAPGIHTLMISLHDGRYSCRKIN